jgi:AcrR family transcriptional regulator
MGGLSRGFVTEICQKSLQESLVALTKPTYNSLNGEYMTSRDRVRSQKSILEAAKLEFAERGLGGARVDRIAERSGLNKRLIYYYFSNKERLFTAVLEASYEDIRSAERALQLDALTPTEAIKSLTSFTWHYYLKNPHFLTLLNSENLHQGKHIATSQPAKTTNSALIQGLGQILERGRADGTFRGGIDPLQLYISIAGLAYFYLSNQHTLSAIFERKLASSRALDQRLSHILEVVMGYVLQN